MARAANSSVAVVLVGAMVVSLGSAGCGGKSSATGIDKTPAAASPSSGPRAVPTATATVARTDPPAVPPTPARTSADDAAVLAVVGRFETAREARSADDLGAAWSLLAPRSQRTIGDLAVFGRLADAFIAEGGSEYRIVAATQDPGRFDPLALGDGIAADLAPSVAAGRAWIVDVSHPNVRGTSASSEVLAVAPGTDTAWRIWLVH